jgi:hypothetical protein
MEIPVKKLLNNIGSVSAITLGLGCQLLPSVDFVEVGKKFIKPDFSNGQLGYNLSIQRGFPYRGFQTLGLVLGLVNVGVLLSPLIEKAYKEEKEPDEPKELLPDELPSESTEDEAGAVFAPRKLKVTSRSEKLRATDKDILEWLETPHQSVAGNSGCGKTTVMQFVISLWLDQNPNGELIILDSNIGKPDSSGKPNNWKGLAKNYGKASLSDIAESMDAIHDELKKRLQICRDAVKNEVDYLEFNPMLIVIDEFNSLQSDLQEELKYNIVPKVQLLLQQGRALKMKVVLGMQSYDFKTSNLPMASNAQTSKLWLGYKDLPNSRQFGYLDITDRDEVKNDFINLIKDKQRAGLIQINGANRAINMPDLSSQINIQVDDAEVWWQEWSIEHWQLLERAKTENISASEIAESVTPKVRRGTPRFKKIQSYLNQISAV